MPAPSLATQLSGTRVEVYWNLHKHLFSVRPLEGPYKGRVVAHTDSLDLYDVTFTVQPAGRQRVLDEGRKNVHAFIRGVVSAGLPHDTPKAVTYNPYRDTSFVDVTTNRPVTRAHIVKARACDGKATLSAH
jgi:hypothetical protein